MTIPWRFRILVPYAIAVLVLTIWVSVRARRGGVPDEWGYGPAVYVLVPFGFPWSLLAPWGMYFGVIVNAVLCFVLGWFIEGRFGRTA
jgi:hypothetical protein